MARISAALMACSTIVVCAAVISGNSTSCTIVLLGDSLINKPFSEHNLSTIMASLINLPGGPLARSLALINSGNNGEEVASTAARVDSVLAAYNPDAVIQFWDSDCSNVDESTMTPAQVASLRANFSTHEAFVIAAVQRHGALFAVAGPELLGEGPFGLPHEGRFFQANGQNKTAMLDAYRVLVEAAARAAGAPYIDMRAAFMDALPPWTPLSWWRGVVTEDGEHPNQAGTVIEATLFAAQINEWVLSTGLCSAPSGPSLMEQ